MQTIYVIPLHMLAATFQMMSRALFCRTEREINSEEDDYLPDLDSQPIINYDGQNVPQGTKVTFRATKQDVIITARKSHT